MKKLRSIRCGIMEADAERSPNEERSMNELISIVIIASCMLLLAAIAAVMASRYYALRRALGIVDEATHESAVFVAKHILYVADSLPEPNLGDIFDIPMSLEDLEEIAREEPEWNNE
jgi:hypothetical protein